MKKGFTLVELSIVLVIIGLLIGGILAAQSMINTAKIQSTARQIGQFDAAVNNFYTLYNELPGDSPKASVMTAGTNGLADSDFTIESSGGGRSAFSGEIANFWFDLAKIGLKNEDGTNYTGTPADGSAVSISAGVNVPEGEVGTNTNILAFGISGQNYYFLSNASGSGAITTAGSIKPVDALALDTKLDDAVANSGYVKSTDISGLTNSYIGIIPGTCTTGANIYAVSTTTNGCQLSIRIGLTAGNPL